MANSRMDPERLSQVPVDSHGNHVLRKVRELANLEKEIPKEYKDLIPSEDISICALLKISIPDGLSTASTLRPAKSCVVSEPPTWTRDLLKAIRVSSKEWLKELDGAITEEWLGGAHSVEHPSDAAVRFPLWVGEFWTLLSEVVQQQKEWRRAHQWIQATFPRPTEPHEVQELFSKIPWTEYIWILPVMADRGSTKFSFFSHMLSDGLLAENHIDAFVSCLNIRLRKRAPGAPGVFVAGIALSRLMYFCFHAPESKIQKNKALLKYTAIFESQVYHRLLFPTHVGDSKSGHWVAFDVDFKNDKYGFGNSLSNVPYKKDVDQICRGLERWMSILLGRQFKNDGQTLPIGAQQDGVSCGICVLNAFEHALFDVPLFTHSNRNSLRAQYFTEIAKLLLDHAPASMYHNTVDELVGLHPTSKLWCLKQDIFTLPQPSIPGDGDRRRLLETLESIFQGSEFPPAPDSGMDNAWYKSVCKSFRDTKACNSHHKLRKICNHIRDELVPRYRVMVNNGRGGYLQFEAFALLPDLSKCFLGEKGCDSCEPSWAAENDKPKCQHCVQHRSSCSLNQIPVTILKMMFAFDKADDSPPVEVESPPIGETGDITTTPNNSDEIEEAIKRLDLLIVEKEQRVHQLVLELGERVTTHADPQAHVPT